MSEVAGSTIASPVISKIKTPLDVAKKDEKVCTCTVPRTFRITLPTQAVVEVKAGVQELPESIFSHWYAKAHGVQAYVPEAPKAGAPTPASPEAEKETPPVPDEAETKPSVNAVKAPQNGKK